MRGKRRSEGLGPRAGRIFGLGIVVGLILAAAGTAAVAAGSGVWTSGPSSSDSSKTAAGANLNATFSLAGPYSVLNGTILSASPCYQLAPSTQACNVSFATTILANNTCHNKSNIGSFSGVSFRFKGTFYFESSDPSLPKLITACGPGPAEQVFHLVFHMVQQSGTVTERISLNL